VEFYVTFSGDPDRLFEKPGNGWYRESAVVTLKRLGPDIITSAPSIRLVFDGWYVNSQKLNCTSCLGLKPIEVVVSEPLKIQGRYRTEYYVNVTSQYGKVEGSGWYPADSIAFFSVDRSAVPTEGPLGLLGLKHSFTGWIGSNNFRGLQVDPTGSLIVKEPTTIEATWQDDWASLNLNLLLIAAATLIGFVVVFRSRIQSFTATRRLKTNPRNDHNWASASSRLLVVE
jgi:hypothetical protein